MVGAGGYNPSPYCHILEDAGKHPKPLTQECFEERENLRRRPLGRSVAVCFPVAASAPSAYLLLRTKKFNLDAGRQGKAFYGEIAFFNVEFELVKWLNGIVHIVVPQSNFLVPALITRIFPASGSSIVFHLLPYRPAPSRLG